MYKDEIIEEIHKNREEYAKSFNYDLNAILQDLKSKENAHSQKIVRLPIKKNIASPIVNTVKGNLMNQYHSGSGDNIGRDKNTTNIYNSQDLTQAAKNIQALLEQIDKSHDSNTTTGKMMIATQAIKHIENDANLTKRIVSTLRTGSISALEALLDHPAASFVITAIEDWQQSKK